MEIVKIEAFKLDIKELCLIGSALEDAEIVERRRCVEAIKRGDSQRAMYNEEKAEAMKVLASRLYALLHNDELQEG